MASLNSEFFFIMAMAVLLIVLAVTMGLLIARAVQARLKQRYDDQQSKSEVKDIQDRINRLRLEVDVYLHEKSPRGQNHDQSYENRGSREKDE